MRVNWIDVLILGMVTLSTLIGLVRGITREILSLVIWALSLFLAWRHYEVVVPHLEPWLPGSTLPRVGAILILTLGLALLGGMVAYLFTSLLELVGLGMTTSLLGGLFGALRGALILGMLAFLAALTPLPEQEVWQNSRLVGRFQVLAERLLEQMPPELEGRVRTL